MARGDFKANPWGIIRAHRRTYIDVRSGRPRWQDRLTFDGVPIAILVMCLVFHVVLGPAASVGLLTVSGLLGALLFGVLVQVSGAALDLADSQPEPGPATSAHATFLEELAANASYASLVCITAAVVFVVASIWLRLGPPRQFRGRTGCRNRAGLGAADGDEARPCPDPGAAHAGAHWC